MGEVVYLFGDQESGKPRNDPSRASILDALVRAQTAPEKMYLQKALPILIHWPSYGRNAWHSTWINRYRRGALLADRNEARAYVEKNRKQGSVYRLTVMPALHLQFPTRSYVVVEINTHKPFSRLIEPRFLSREITEAECLALLNPNSPIWEPPSPKHDSIIVQQTSRPSSHFQRFEDRTALPNQVRTLGRYRRANFGSYWEFVSTEDDGIRPPYDHSSFEDNILPSLADGDGSDEKAGPSERKQKPTGTLKPPQAPFSPPAGLPHD